MTYEYTNVYSDNAYARYRRRPPPSCEAERLNDPGSFGRLINKKRAGKIVKITNAHVVSYNPFLSLKYATQ
jgi:hypothetical protein